MRRYRERGQHEVLQPHQEAGPGAGNLQRGHPPPLPGTLLTVLLKVTQIQLLLLPGAQFPRGSGPQYARDFSPEPLFSGPFVRSCILLQPVKTILQRMSDPRGRRPNPLGVLAE